MDWGFQLEGRTGCGSHVTVMFTERGNGTLFFMHMNLVYGLILTVSWQEPGLLSMALESDCLCSPHSGR